MPFFRESIWQWPSLSSLMRRERVVVYKNIIWLRLFIVSCPASKNAMIVCLKQWTNIVFPQNFRNKINLSSLCHFSNVSEVAWEVVIIQILHLLADYSRWNNWVHHKSREFLSCVNRVESPAYICIFFLIYLLNKHSVALFNSLGFLNPFVNLDSINLFALR